MKSGARTHFPGKYSGLGWMTRVRPSSVPALRTSADQAGKEK